MSVQTLFQVRRGTKSEWDGASAALGAGILYQGEIGYETDTKRFKIGDGTTAWSSLAYASVLPSGFIAGSGISITPGANGSSITISLSDPTIQVSDITDFDEGVDDRVSNLLNAGTGVGINYNDFANTLTVSVTGIPTTLISNFSGEVSSIINSNINTSIVAGSGVDIVYNSGANTLTISSPIIAGSGISLGYSSGAYTINSISSTVTLSGITDLSTAARDFLLTPSSENLAILVTNETGSGALVFADNPTLSGVTINGDLTVGGSGLLASNINDFDTQVRTNRLDQMTAPTGNVSFNNVKIINLATPVDDTDAANKAYVDAARAGLDVKNSVRVATTGEIALSGLQTIDTISVVADNRILVKDQGTASQNGIYVASTGNWSRASDADTNDKVTAGMFTFVSDGFANADTGWVLTTNDAINLGSTSLSFTQFSGAGQIVAGSGLVKTGSTLDVVGTAGRVVVNADSVDLATVSQTDTTGSNGVSFIQTVNRDSYGRVTGVVSATVQDATTSAKGIASFDSGDFSVTSGAVTIKVSGVDNNQLVNSSVTIGSTSVSLGNTITSVSGLTSVTSTSFVGDLTGNADTATTATNANNIEVDVSSSNINNLVFVSGTDGNLKPNVNNNIRFNAASNELLGSSGTTPTTTLKYFIIDGGTP